MIAGIDPTVGSIALVGLGGVLTALVWYGFGTPYAIAAGHVVFLALVPDGLDRSSLVLVETAFLTMLLVAATRTSRPGRFAFVAVAGTAGLAGTAWIALETQPLWLATVALFAVIGLATYGLHRYELVRLGLVSEAAEPIDPSDGDTETEIETETETDPRTTTNANVRGQIRR